MNLHPLVVHFPIAFLTLYAFLEIVRFRKLAAQPWWFPLKAVLVMVGGLGALAARQTGEMIEHEFRASGVMGRVLDAHQSAANATIAVFGIVAAAYLVTWVCQSQWGIRLAASAKWGNAVKFAAEISERIRRPPVAVFLACCGLLLLIVTGGLGGILAYGPDVDPVTKILFSLFH